MKSFARLLLATLAMTTSLVIGMVLILFISAFALAYFGPVQALAAMVLMVSFVITVLIHWSEQKNFPFR
jgi:hypothetical protein